MSERVAALVLAGGRVDDLAVLTAERPKSAVPVWGMYRVIDFVLSNLLHSGVPIVGVLTQYRPLSLAGHLADGSSWDYAGRTRTLRILSPYQVRIGSDWYKGTADAIYQNLHFLDHFRPDVVLVASADHVYAMDYRPLLREHLERGADLTMALTRVPIGQAHRYGTAALDANGRVVSYQEKTATPASDLASMTVYAFRYEALVARIRQNATEGHDHQIYSEVIPRMVAEGDRVQGHVFQGYWRYARTLDEYYATNMEVLGPSATDMATWGVRTNLYAGMVADPPPAFFSRDACVERSFVGAGARIEGNVEGSVLSPGVVVERGAVVRGSVLFHHAVVRAGARVDRAILDKDVHVGAGAEVGAGEPRPNETYPDSLRCGAVVIGKGTQVPPGTRVGRGCIVRPWLGAEAWPAKELAPGTSVLT